MPPFPYADLPSYLRDYLQTEEKKKEFQQVVDPYLIPDLQALVWSYFTHEYDFDMSRHDASVYTYDKWYTNVGVRGLTVSVLLPSTYHAVPRLHISWNTLAKKGEAIYFRGDPSSSTLEAWLCGVHLANHEDKFKDNNLWHAGKRVTRVVDDQKDFNGLCIETFDRLCLLLRELDDQLIVEREREVAASSFHNRHIMDSYQETMIELNRIRQSNDLFSGIFAYFHEECARKVAYNEKMNTEYHSALGEFYRKRKRDNNEDET